MNTEQKKKLELLKSQAQTKERKQSLQKNVLLQECLEALGTFEILEKEDQIKNIEFLVKLQDAEMYSYQDRIILDEELNQCYEKLAINNDYEAFWEMVFRYAEDNINKM